MFQVKQQLCLTRQNKTLNPLNETLKNVNKNRCRLVVNISKIVQANIIHNILRNVSLAERFVRYHNHRKKIYIFIGFCLIRYRFSNNCLHCITNSDSDVKVRGREKHPIMFKFSLNIGKFSMLFFPDKFRNLKYLLFNDLLKIRIIRIRVKLGLENGDLF